MPLTLSTSSPALDPATLPAAIIPGLYVHIPFCFHKCHYCDFYSITRQTPDRMTRFVDLILSEADQWTASPINLRPRTIFFGGGTPSLLPSDQMRRLIEGLRQRLDLSQTIEFTVEANPATVTLEYCQMLRAAGVNRLSFGAQSFNKNELATLERHHDPEDVPKSLGLARSAGFIRLNVDLIYAIPGQSLESWSDSLNRALSYGTTHLSAYNLTYESNTPIAVKKRLGQLIPTEESIELQMLHHARQRLAAAGLPPYEVSNYAAPGQECQHNLLYWTGQNYIGLGPSAASHIEGHRWKNRPHLGEWELAIDSHHLPAADIETLTPHQRAGELAMLMLRLSRGIVFKDFESQTRLNPLQHYQDIIHRFTQAGLLYTDSTHTHLTEQGISVADALAAEFLTYSPSPLVGEGRGEG